MNSRSDAANLPHRDAALFALRCVALRVALRSAARGRSEIILVHRNSRCRAEMNSAAQKSALPAPSNSRYSILWDYENSAQRIGRESLVQKNSNSPLYGKLL